MGGALGNSGCRLVWAGVRTAWRVCRQLGGCAVRWAGVPCAGWVGMS